MYGSRAKGTHRNSSDIDLTLIGSGLNATHLALIDQSIDDQLLRYQMDLPWYANLTHPALLEHIQRVGIVLYERAVQPACLGDDTEIFSDFDEGIDGLIELLA